MMDVFFIGYWQNVQNALSGMQNSLQGIAYALLAITFLMGFYEAFVGGPSFKQVGVLVLKYAICAGIIANWSTFFSDVVSAGTAIGNTYLTGVPDICSNLSNALSSQLSGTGLTAILAGGLSQMALSIAELLIVFSSAMIFFAFMKIFAVFYCMWGAVLFGVGPLLVALGPSGITSSYTRTYIKGLVEWAMWPALYCLFVVLMTAMKLDALTSWMNTPGVTSGSVIAADQATYGVLLASILALVYTVCMLAIPWIAHIIIGGGNFASFTSALSSLTVGNAMMAMGALNGGMSAMKNLGKLSGGGGGSSSGGSSDTGGAGSAPYVKSGAAANMPPAAVEG